MRKNTLIFYEKIGNLQALEARLSDSLASGSLAAKSFTHPSLLTLRPLTKRPQPSKKLCTPHPLYFFLITVP